MAGVRGQRRAKAQVNGARGGSTAQTGDVAPNLSPGGIRSYESGESAKGALLSLESVLADISARALSGQDAEQAHFNQLAAGIAAIMAGAS
ncbi:MAG: hypothetical protein KDI51_09010, partial [Xanthomonadales bacterium]|nr:hypothetical protein [Xanthomonadales bacterium]